VQVLILLNLMESFVVHCDAYKMGFGGVLMQNHQVVYVCLICQKSKIEHQPLFVPEWKWDSISMYFVGALPKTVKGSHSIWVIVDQLTKLAYFIPIKTDMFVARLA